jgi:hypothetical protein
VIVCDTGPLVAAALSNDADHPACVRLFTELHAAGRELLIPATVVAEVGYLLAREAGPRVESLFLRSLADGDFTAVDLTRPTTRGWPNSSPPTATSHWEQPTPPSSPWPNGSTCPRWQRWTGGTSLSSSQRT